jgi:hypothetical protein
MLIVYYITIISCYPSEKLEVVGGRFANHPVGRGKPV